RAQARRRGDRRRTEADRTSSPPPARWAAATPRKRAPQTRICGSSVRLRFASATADEVSAADEAPDRSASLPGAERSENAPTDWRKRPGYSAPPPRPGPLQRSANASSDCLALTQSFPPAYSTAFQNGARVLRKALRNSRDETDY